LVVKVARAESVWAKSRGNVSDPYCILSVGAASARTRVIPNTLNPEWEETLTLPYDRMHR
jgi:Ca2+-dependent lipid-binding protein